MRTDRRAKPTRYITVKAGPTMALDISEISEIVPYAELLQPPVSGPIIAGLIDIGGKMLTVLSLARLLGCEPPAPGLNARIIRLKHANPPLALLVESVFSFVDAESVRLSPVDGLATFNDCVTTELTRDGEPVAHILDTEKLLTRYEQEQIAAFVRIAEERHQGLEVTV